jgi:hypothetical protein
MANDDLVYHYRYDDELPKNQPLHFGTLKAAETRANNTDNPVLDDYTGARIKGRLFAARVVKPTVNQPHEPLSDAHANQIANPEGDYGRPPSGSPAFKGGIWYKNSYEDKGSSSLVVPDSSHVEVVHSTPIDPMEKFASKRISELFNDRRH